ncbi:MAG TPA: hypothetical protein VJ672_04640 [Gemmatimonadaceae bacterium]|nr:hypothetical protein [Gemmatimonadaceae bacterium]
MERGTKFLSTQVSYAVLQHQAFLDSLRDHEQSARDIRLRDLCTKFVPIMQEHQRMLERYQDQIGAEPGVAKKILGAVVSVGRDLADVAVQSDYYRLMGDILMSRQAEDTLKTFREAGRALGMDELYRIGEVGERHHDDYAREANRLAQQIFVEHVRGVDLTAAVELDQRPTI